jgi:uncharacterized protein (TIGR02266 family)
MSSKRQHPRIQTNISVKIKGAGGQTTSTQRILNLSLGGVFVEMDDPLNFGQELELEFSLPSVTRQIRCKGFVVWTTKTSPERAQGKKGIGVRLMDIGIADMRVLSEFIEQNLG